MFLQAEGVLKYLQILTAIRNQKKKKRRLWEQPVKGKSQVQLLRDLGADTEERCHLRKLKNTTILADIEDGLILH